MTKLESIQKELRHQRQDLVDIKRMLQRLMIDEHLQMQVDKYFDQDNDESNTPPEDSPQEGK